jgi:two-component system OmpR family response regulator
VAWAGGYSSAVHHTENILVVDDHGEMRDLVSRLLREEGFHALTAGDGRDMRRVMNERPVDLVILDLMLPGIDGLRLFAQMRAEGVATPVIFLSAKGSEIDRVMGLELGADDYVAKPFSGRELVARVKAVLRRAGREAHPETPKGRYRFSDWLFDPARRELVGRDDVVVPLSTGEYNVLLVFVQNPGKVMTRERLLDLARGRDSMPFDRAIDTVISRLRRKLGDDARHSAIIKTVWGGGYVFVPHVATE